MKIFSLKEMGNGQVVRKTHFKVQKIRHENDGQHGQSTLST